MRRILTWLGAVLLAVAIAWSAVAPASADEKWQEISETVASLVQEVPALHEAGDAKGVEAALRKAYYEEYQAKGLEDEIKHRLGADRAKAFQTAIVELRNLSREDAPQAEIDELTAALLTQLSTDVEEVQTAPEVTDRWGRVAASIVEAANNTLALHEQGKHDDALKEATRAYLQHYEADGLEKATLSYLPGGRAAQVEAQFRALRVGARDGAPIEELRATAETLGQMVTEDAVALDSLGASESVGWSGFVAAFVILLREGVEALLVVAAVIAYVVKTGRRDQLRGVYLGIGAAALMSIALALTFSSLSSSGALGLTQELLEGFVGFLAVAMLIYISSWILSKSEGDAWHRYINATIDKKAESGGRWALFAVVFLAVAREGFETILFFVPVFGAAQTSGDHLLIWAGVATAVVLLATLFVAVRFFGVKLPLRPFFRWMAVLLSILAVTMAGGAAKELQDAMILEVTPLPGMPTVEWLGLYPTVETLVTQGIVAVIVVALAVWQFRKSSAVKADTPLNKNTEERVETK
ncbi:FTR1 family iron permease [Tessaracoccus caeni]|uniref:FTR1 family iron permease n=1 Tax=Tessaracoccus caeni TaxID=3031239 RepID=UPI0023DC93AF|nr:FTR1 family protein [Tessaracoccus caeni]MDF1487870.1 FTR1 family iron permease [Tessaracoccus caeni]